MARVQNSGKAPAYSKPKRSDAAKFGSVRHGGAKALRPGQYGHSHGYKVPNDSGKGR